MGLLLGNKKERDEAAPLPSPQAAKTLPSSAPAPRCVCKRSRDGFSFVVIFTSNGQLLQLSNRGGLSGETRVLQL